VAKGGTQYVACGSTAKATEVSFGGTEMVSSGGVSVSGTVHGRETVAAFGIDSATVIGSGGMVSVVSGGVVSGGLTLSGGTAVISGAVSAGQGRIFAGSGGTLALNNPAAFAATISGFVKGDVVDLYWYAYGSTSTSSYTSTGPSSGKLRVTAGTTQAATLSFAGAYTISSFVLSSDGHGGTFIKHT
jgi:autotransporter passenger strand-loop-strand repeat protein